MPPAKGTIGRRPEVVAKVSGTEVGVRPVPPKGGACVGHPTHLWYPVGHNEKRGASSGSDAMKICHGCPVQLECLMYGLEWEQFGVWGGTSEHGRKLIRSKLRISVARTEYE